MSSVNPEPFVPGGSDSANYVSPEPVYQASPAPAGPPKATPVFPPVVKPVFPSREVPAIEAGIYEVEAGILVYATDKTGKQLSRVRGEWIASSEFKPPELLTRYLATKALRLVERTSAADIMGRYPATEVEKKVVVEELKTDKERADDLAKAEKDAADLRAKAAEAARQKEAAEKGAVLAVRLRAAEVGIEPTAEQFAAAKAAAVAAQVKSAPKAGA